MASSEYVDLARLEKGDQPTRRAETPAAGDFKVEENRPHILRKTARRASNVARDLVGGKQTEVLSATRRVSNSDGVFESTHITTHTFKSKMQYKVDVIFGSRLGQVNVLFGSCILYVFLCGAVYMQVNESGEFWEAFWESWTYMSDAGTHAGGPPTLAARIVAFFITWGGVMFFSVIIGFVYDAIQVKMDSLKKGKSGVVEEGHTLMLGWSAFSIEFILEICDANSSEGGGVIVVLAENEKEALERAFYMQVKKKELLGTKLVFRCGSALSKPDLQKVSAHRAKSILVLAQDEGDADRKDAVTLRSVLTVMGMGKLQGHIVAELRDVDNERMVQSIGGSDIEIVVSHDIIGRLLLMSARSPGLAMVYGDILGFDGDEFYMEEWPELVGVSFSEICTRMPDASPFAIKTPIDPLYGDGNTYKITIVPDMDRKLEEGEELVVLAEDDDTYSVKPDCCGKLKIGNVPDSEQDQRGIENVLIVGWRRDIRDMLIMLDDKVAHGTVVHLLATVPLNDRQRLLLESGFNPRDLRNYTLKHHEGNTSARKDLDYLPLHEYTSMIILADQSNELNIMESDSQILATLLLIRDIQKNKAGTEDVHAMCPIICELLDSSTQKTISTNKFVAETSEYIQSNKLISQALAMIAENRAVKQILTTLLGSGGADLQLYDAKRYIGDSEKTSFMVAVKRAQQRNEIVVGYFENRESCINPKNKLEARRWNDVMFVVMVQVKPKQGIHQDDLAMEPIECIDPAFTKK
jgi:hypothetical protein